MRAEGRRPGTLDRGLELHSREPGGDHRGHRRRPGGQSDRAPSPADPDRPAVVSSRARDRDRGLESAGARWRPAATSRSSQEIARAARAARRRRSCSAGTFRSATWPSPSRSPRRGSRRTSRSSTSRSHDEEVQAIDALDSGHADRSGPGQVRLGRRYRPPRGGQEGSERDRQHDRGRHAAESAAASGPALRRASWRRVHELMKTAVALSLSSRGGCNCNRRDARRVNRRAGRDPGKCASIPVPRHIWPASQREERPVA